MSYTAGVLLMVAAVAIVTGAVLQIGQYRRGDHIITRRQFAIRMVTAALLLLIIGLIFFGSLYPWQSALHALVFAMFLTFLAVVVVFLAFGDLRQIEVQKHLRQAEIYRKIQELQDMQEDSSQGSKQ